MGKHGTRAKPCTASTCADVAFCSAAPQAADPKAAVPAELVASMVPKDCASSYVAIVNGGYGWACRGATR